jgi:hypothetical protein
MEAFTPKGATVSLAVTAATGRVALTAPGGSGGSDVRLYNAGGATVFVAFGNSAVEAAITSMPIPSGAVEVFSAGPGSTHVAAITAAGTATLYATTGRGL